jgi:catechol 2,3-dioxygenase-like lactoylglutathione lyase family enzyme
MPCLGLMLRAKDSAEIGYGPPEGRIRFWVTRPYDDKPATIGNGSMPALIAPTRAAVDAFHQAALAHGGTDEGTPGLRPYGASFYACYVRDPDGNKLSAVCETPE